MNCDCIAKNEKRLLDANPECKRKKVESVRFTSLAYFPNETRCFSTFDVSVVGVARTYPMNLLWDFCPFCGAKAVDESEGNINERV